MKKLILLLIPIMLFQCGSKDDKMIKSNRVGNLVLGKPKAVIMERLSNYRVEKLQENGMSELGDYYNVYKGEKLMFSLFFILNQLSGVEVHSNNYYTDHGIKIGNTAQEVMDKGHQIWSIARLETSLRAQTDDDKLYFYFDKMMAGDRIGKHATLKRITVGYPFDIFEELEKLKEKNIVLSQMDGSVFYSDIFNMEFEVPENWQVKTNESNIPTVNELLFITDQDNESSLLIIAEKLKNKNIWNGYDYLSLGEGLLLSKDQIKIKPVLIADKEFYTAKIEVLINDSIKQKQIHYASVQNDYAILITAKYTKPQNEKIVKSIIQKIKTHNVSK